MSYLDHIDPGNSGGSVQIPERLPRTKLVKNVYPCPICEEVFDTEDMRRQHRVSEHPIKRPYLYIKGKSPRHELINIRSVLSKDDLRIEDADSFELDGEYFDRPEDALNKLISCQKGMKRIVITHQNYHVKYKLDFDIADEKALNEIEEIFYSIFSNGLPMSMQLELFYEKVRSLESGMSYAGALGCYISAIMAKDRMPNASIPFEQYLNKLGEALDLLESLDRPLAKSIESIISFMDNNFSEFEGDFTIPAVQLAKAYFRTGTFQPHECVESENKKIPVDIITEMLTKLCIYDWPYRVAQLSTIEMMQKAPTVPEKDKLKMLFILWGIAKHNCDKNAVEMYSKKLIHTNLFDKLIV